MTPLRCQGITRDGRPCRVKLLEFLEGRAMVVCRRCGTINTFEAKVAVIQVDTHRINVLV